MKESFVIKRIAVLGAGVMGAQIAAHCVNAGFETYLYDLCSQDGPRNAIVDKAILQLTKQTPTPLATAQVAGLLKAKNYDDDLAELGTCSLIIEAIAERLDWKEALFKKIAPVLTSDSVLVSNSSGLSMSALALALPEINRERFCGVHFFNPPRYMHLAELIPTQYTSLALLDKLETWLTSYLGKGVIRAKDTPNFIANRIGVFSLLSTIHHAERFGLALDEVDALTGALLGRPKSATYRTLDVVGLDTMQHVVHTMKTALTQDPWVALFELPQWMMALIEQDHLGQKSGMGIYRKKGPLIEVYSPQEKTYLPVKQGVNAEVKEILSIRDPRERINRLFESTAAQAQFLCACFLDLFHYCAFHLEDIADTARDVDEAMQWGFGWASGPFETWQMFGVNDITKRIEQAIQQRLTTSDAPLPIWLFTLHDFYAESGAFSPSRKVYQEKRELPVYAKQISHMSHPILFENDGVTVRGLPDDILTVSFKSKANSIGQAVLDGLQEALALAETTAQGLIIYQQDSSNFSAGADLRAVGELIDAKKLEKLEAMLHTFQQTAMRIKYSAIPVVAALRGRALGGGCELMMHCDAVIAAFESYPGLVEAGVGLIPAGGGCKEWAMRAARAGDKTELTRLIRTYFEQTAKAVVASSATDAYVKGFLQSTDAIMMNANEVLFGSVETIKAMNARNYKPPMQTGFKVAGREGHAALQAGLINWLEGGFISEHDYLLANKLAYVMCGGDVYAGEVVDEAWLLKLEREAFIQLAETRLTQARISHLLETGKPLRN
jgi:3-hydroxyacyl-CoA dehydrogenase